MATPHVRLDLVPDGPLDGEERRWTLRVNGTDFGALQGLCDGSEVHLALTVDDAARELGVERAALGRLMGSAPWGSDVRYVLPLDGVAPETARGTGFRLVDAHGTGRWERDAPRPRSSAQDITRFLDRDGRIDRYPHQPDERRRLLEWVADRALPPGRVLSEAQINELLAPYAPAADVAVLRRYLVDHELVERTRSGSEYARVAD